MKCAACGCDAGDDARCCPVCGKSLSGNKPESQAGEVATGSAVSGSSCVSGERLCHCCQTPLRRDVPSAATADSRRSGGTEIPVPEMSGGGGTDVSDSTMVLSLVKEMKTMTWWIICGAVFMVLTCALPWLTTHLELLFSIALFLGLGILTTQVVILLKTPSLVQKCGELCRDDGELAKRISRVRQHLKDRWKFFILDIVFLSSLIVFVGLLVLVSFLGLLDSFFYAFTGTKQTAVTWDAFTLLLCVAGVFGVLFLASCIADLVVQAFMFVDFFRVRKVIGRMTVRNC